MKNELYKEGNKKRVMYSIVIYLLTLVIFILAVIFLYNYKARMSGILVAIIAAVAVGVLLWGYLILDHGTIRTVRYCCCNCKGEFIPSKKGHLIKAQIMGKCYMECPFCLKRSWCKKLY